MQTVIQNLRYRAQEPELDGYEIAKMLEEGYLKERKETKWTKKKTFRPSDMGFGSSVCPRYQYLMLDGVDYVDTATAQDIANMMEGRSIHERLEKIFDNTGKLVSKEVEILVKDPPIRGFIDVIIRWNDELVIGEIKSTKPEAFLYRQTTMQAPFYHLIQILIYMKATGKKRGFLLYENKGNQNFLVIPVKMTDENAKIVDDVYEWLRTVYQAYTDQTLPKRPYRKSSKMCKSCSLFDICWNEKPDGEIELQQMPT